MMIPETTAMSIQPSKRRRRLSHESVEGKHGESLETPLAVDEPIASTSSLRPIEPSSKVGVGVRSHQHMKGELRRISRKSVTQTASSNVRMKNRQNAAALMGRASGAISPLARR
jgi:hypothetical protein